MTLKTLKGGTNTNTSECLKIHITDFKDKRQSLSSLSYQYVGSPGAFTDMPDYPNLYIKGKKMKTKSGCLLGTRVKQVESELCTESMTVIKFNPPKKKQFLETTFKTWKQHFKICMCEIGYFALYSPVCNSFSYGVSISCYSKAYHYFS